ncbi:MAG: TRAP transporter large permease [Phycisphaerae bacterium]
MIELSPEVLLVVSFGLGVLLGLPIAFCLGISSLLTMWWIQRPLSTVAQSMVDGMDTFSLMAIPFFVLAGQVMARGGMARRMVDVSNLLVGPVRGGLGMVNIVASMFFGGISGSSVADTSSIGSVLIPMMDEQGYDRDFSVCVTITSSTQGIVIPPSHNAILYAFAAGGGAVSIKALFMAGVIPGVLVGLSLMVVTYIVARVRNYPSQARPDWKTSLRIAVSSLPGMFTAVIIVGGILSGIFTATESSAIAVVYALLVTYLLYRDVGPGTLPRILLDSIKTIAMVMLLIGTAKAFGFVVTFLGIPERITAWMVGISDNPMVILLLINLMLLVLGMLMDMAPLILITTPILLPVARQIGMDPVHFGIMMMLNLGIGLCTPPVGSTLFVGCAVGRTSIERVTRAIWPFYLAMIFVLLLVTYVPQLTLWLPKFVG